MVLDVGCKIIVGQNNSITTIIYGLKVNYNPAKELMNARDSSKLSWMRDFHNTITVADRITNDCDTAQR